MSDTLHISPNMIDPFVVGVVDEELPQEVVKDEDEGDVQCEVGHVAKAVLYPDPVPLSPEENINATCHSFIQIPQTVMKLLLCWKYTVSQSSCQK